MQKGMHYNAPKRIATREIIKQLEFTSRLKGRRGKTRLQSVVDSLLTLAETGDLGAIKEVFDRIEGRPMQAVQLAGTDEDGNPAPTGMSAPMLSIQFTAVVPKIIDGEVVHVAESRATIKAPVQAGDDE